MGKKMCLGDSFLHANGWSIDAGGTENHFGPLSVM
jgi:hypothetical protein